MHADLLRSIQRIYAGARAANDGALCCVAPHPDLQTRIRQALEAARSSADPVIQPLLKVQETRRIGFNDGLIIPGDQLPLGTPPSVVRSFALERAPLRGNVRVIVVLVDDHAPVARFRFRDGWPSKWEGPKFNAKSSESAIETLEIAHEGLAVEVD